MLLHLLQSMRSPQRVAALVLFVAAAVIGTALAFEHVGGYTPCPLCLEERYGYYAAIPALAIALVLLSTGRRGAATAVLVLVALAFLANGAVGVYHAGAEWKLWAGPETCGASQPLSTGAGGLLKDLASTRVIRCDEAPWHFFGLSFAGWNAVASIVLAAGALYAAIKARAG
jgi:disulfide bond formation protein DsbB